MKHQWYRPGAGYRGGSRKCLRCGIRRRIKRGTRFTWEFQRPEWAEMQAWVRSWPCRPVPVEEG